MDSQNWTRTTLRKGSKNTKQYVADRPHNLSSQIKYSLETPHGAPPWDKTEYSDRRQSQVDFSFGYLDGEQQLFPKALDQLPKTTNRHRQRRLVLSVKFNVFFAADYSQDPFIESRRNWNEAMSSYTRVKDHYRGTRGEHVV